MLQSVARFLETRLDPDVVMVVLTPVPGDALRYLREGLVWCATYSRGRLLGEVGVDDLLAAGHHAPVRSWLEIEGETASPLYALLQGQSVAPATRTELDFDTRIRLLLADHGAGRAVGEREFAELERVAHEEDELDSIRGLRGHVSGESPRRLPPSDAAPVRALVDDADADIYDFIVSGDLSGSLAQLRAMVARAETARASHRDWLRIAEMCRFLTGDDEVAMAWLDRARFADVREEWVELFGPLGEARVAREKQDVLQAIEAAFDGVPFPGRGHYSLYQAEAADSYGGCGQDRDHKGRWQDLPRQHILQCQWALTHLGAGSLPYYLPAIMSFAVREHDREREDHGVAWIFESLGYHLAFDLGDRGLRDYARKRHSLFSREQLGAVARFAEYYGAEPVDVARWQQLAVGGAWPAGGK